MSVPPAGGNTGEPRADRGRVPSPGRAAEIRHALKAGQYEVSPRLVAEAMLRSGALWVPHRPEPRD